MARFDNRKIIGLLLCLGAVIVVGAGWAMARSTTAAMLAAKGLDAATAASTSASLLARAVTGQSIAIAFDTAFNAIALFLVTAVQASSIYTQPQTVQFYHDRDRFDRNNRRGGVLGDADRDGVPNKFDRDSRLYDARAAYRHVQWGTSTATA